MDYQCLAVTEPAEASTTKEKAEVVLARNGKKSSNV